MAPIIRAMRDDPRFNPILCVTGQHREMMNSMLAHFQIEPDYHLDIMQSSQGLSDITCLVLKEVERIIDRTTPDFFLVQGDTTTVMAASLAALYKKVPIGHIEAGLRTGNIYAPWPEEANRKITGSIATLHFCPTLSAKENLLRESVPERHIFVTGNTVIDALHFTLGDIEDDSAYQRKMRERFSYLKSSTGVADKRNVILVTGHRRENFGQGLIDICEAIDRLSTREDILVVYPVHLNPNVRKPVFNMLGDKENVVLLDPLDYRDFIFFMKNSRIILTDSGGVQEEAPSLKKPTLVMRDVSERMEAIESGAAKLVGTNPDTIYRETVRLIENIETYEDMRIDRNPYGDGNSSKKILDAISDYRHSKLNR